MFPTQMKSWAIIHFFTRENLGKKPSKILKKKNDLKETGHQATENSDL